ncbi:hypothetical protein ABMA28_008871 [Loxostege sticticalis]|uniref:Phospholipase A2 n=1 Tax=Loxostege sticticalis TaxID=481309 RepID=A0ABD0SH49_LOXSC
MSPTKISPISLVVVVNLVGYSNSWVFTDINYTQLKRDFIDVDLFGNELTDEDLKPLKFSLIYPGTKWCGAGNIADSYDDLGPARETDMCCREHDNCPDLMTAGETRMNLTNNAFYTRLSCECDERFRRCLHNANSSVAEQIGNIYFNALGTECFREDYPVTGCQRRGGWFNKKCLQYTYDMQGAKAYQWFDVPNY